jgi:RNA polymerase sigma-70 factor (ECF subfamily)
LSFDTEGEKNKFEYLYEKYKRLLLKKAYGILGDFMLAEDAVSEAYLRVYKNLGKIDDPDSGRSIAFLVTIVKNAALTLLKKEMRNTSEELFDNQEDGFELENYVVSAISSDEQYKTLNRIGEEQRSVFLMKYAYDYSNQEIGKALGVNANHVGVLLHRAKKKIAAIMAEEGLLHERT